MTEQQRICRTLESYGFQLDRTAKARGRKVYRHPDKGVRCIFIVGRSLRYTWSDVRVKLIERSLTATPSMRRELVTGTLTDTRKRRLGLPAV